MQPYELDELWVPVPGYEKYQVSSLGQVLNTNTNRELKGTPNSKGFLQVQLHENGIRDIWYIHRLVAQAFFVDYQDDVEVRHIDQSAITDNSVYNLELGGPCRKKEKR